MRRLLFLRWLARLLLGEINWGEGCVNIDCKDAFPRVMLLTAVAMLLHPGTVLRDIGWEAERE